MNSITRWDPFREIMAMRSAMDRLFDNFYSSGAWQPSATWELPLDVAETKDEFIVQASIPGIKAEDLEITYNANTLTIKGETKEEKDVEEKHYHLRERRYGSFVRSISVPSTIQADAIRAEFDSGVLTLHLPKAEEAKPKRIQIQSGAANVIEAKATDIKNKN